MDLHRKAAFESSFLLLQLVACLSFVMCVGGDQLVMHRFFVPILPALYLLIMRGLCEVFPREAAAVGMKAQEQGIARLEKTYDELLESATRVIKRSRDLTTMMEKKGFIPAPPED